jgi:F-box protein 21
MAQNRPVGVGQNTDTENWPDIDVSLYAALFVLTYLQEGETGTFHEQRRAMQQYLPVLCELFQNNFPWDVSLFEEYILPLLVGSPEYGQMVQILRVVRKADEMKKPVVRRQKTDDHGNITDRTDGKVAFKIGQVFRHKRFRYMGVIIGWDTRCDASEEWVRQMGIDTLEKGREQSFYHVL